MSKLFCKTQTQTERGTENVVIFLPKHTTETPWLGSNLDLDLNLEFATQTPY